MNDDFSVLRETMRDLSEHGGDADLHDRMLVASRRLGRRRKLGGMALVALAVVAISTPFALAGNRQAGPLPGPNVVATEPSVAATTPAPQRSVVVTPPATKTTSAGPAANDGECPVTQKTLFEVIKADGEKVKPGDRYTRIECHDGYAVGLYVQKVPVGDPGNTVFTARTGKWTVVGWGTGDTCAAYLPRDVWDEFGICEYRDPSEACPIGSAEVVEAVRDSRFAREVNDESWAEELACGERYGVARLRNQTTVILSWSQNAQRWSVVDAGPCREVVTSRYADPAVCGN